MMVLITSFTLRRRRSCAAIPAHAAPRAGAGGRPVSPRPVPYVAVGHSVPGATLRWNGRAQNGSALPVGPYVVEITARSGDGQTATVRRNLVNMK